MRVVYEGADGKHRHALDEAKLRKILVTNPAKLSGFEN
jgi:hypothetical protein